LIFVHQINTKLHSFIIAQMSVKMSHSSLISAHQTSNIGCSASAGAAGLPQIFEAFFRSRRSIRASAFYDKIKGHAVGSVKKKRVDVDYKKRRTPVPSKSPCPDRRLDEYYETKA
jgi:hypothetical protein